MAIGEQQRINPQGVRGRRRSPRFAILALAVLVLATAAIRSVQADSAVAASAQAPLSKPFPFEPPFTGIYEDAVEFGTARSDHLSLALTIVNRCYQNANNPTQWSTQVKAMLLLGLNDNLGHDPVPSIVSDADSHIRLGNWFQEAALSYSDRLSRDRLYYQHSLLTSRARANWFQCVIAAVAALATVLVGIKAIWPQTLTNIGRITGVTIGILALVASSSVTALTSLNGYYGSQDEATRDQRTVAQLRQLHWRIINDTEFEKNLCIEQTTLEKMPETTATSQAGTADIYQEMVNKVNAWKQRHEEILNDALPTLAKPGDLPRPGDAGRPGAADPSKPPSPGPTTQASR